MATATRVEPIDKTTGIRVGIDCVAVRVTEICSAMGRGKAPGRRSFDMIEWLKFARSNRVSCSREAALVAAANPRGSVAITERNRRLSSDAIRRCSSPERCWNTPVSGFSLHRNESLCNGNLSRCRHSSSVSGSSAHRRARYSMPAGPEAIRAERNGGEMGGCPSERSIAMLNAAEDRTARTRPDVPTMAAPRQPPMKR